MRFIVFFTSFVGGLAFAQVTAVPGQNLFPKVQQIFNSTQHKCMTCHGVGAHTPLPTTEDDFFKVGSIWVSEDRDPAKSIIYTKMRGVTGGIMPPTTGNVLGTPLSSDELTLLAQWVRLGPVFNSDAVCKQRAVDIVSLMNDLNDDQQRKTLKMSPNIVQSLNSGVDLDIGYADTTGQVVLTDHIKMQLIDVTLTPNKTQKRCVIASFQRQGS